MSTTHRASVRLAILVCLLAATSLATAQEFTRITTVVASTKGHDVFKEPQALAIDLASGSVFIADRGHHQIAMVDPSGTVTVVAGSGKPGKVDGAGLAAQFKEPQGIAIDNTRRVIYIADSGNHLIRRMTFDGVVTTFAGSGRGEDRDGVGTDASFKEPAGLALDPTGNLYVADSGNDKVRVITPSGSVTTFAGTGRPGYGDGPVAQALFKGPRGVAVSSIGIVYVADTKNHTIRKIANGVVSTFAGTTHGGSVDGAPNVAEFKEPSGIALDDLGNLWIADTKNHQIRRIGADGMTTTVAGDGKPGYVDGIDLVRAGFHEPAALAVAGAVFIADSKNDALRMIIPALTVNDFNPRSGSPNGGDIVRIFGSGFIPGRTEVTFGGVPAASVVYVSSTELTVVTPPHPVGNAEVRVGTPAGSVAFAFPFRFIPPFVSLTIAPATATVDIGKTQQFTAAGVAPDNTTTNLTSQVTWTSANPSIVTIDASGLARGIAAGTTTITAAFENLSRTATITVRTPQPLPPDPSTVATPFDPTVVSDMSKRVQFLYTGTNPIQKNLAAGAIDLRRVAVLRGRVLDVEGSPLTGVRVTILGQSYGFTLTRADGMYDLAVNGGGTFTVVFEKSGWITSQRRTATPWRDYVVLDDLFMARFDESATVIQMGAASMQVAQSSLVTDTDGERRATLLIPSGTTATIQTFTGSQPAPALTIRATEFSVGPNGPKLMPAALPPTSAYTYCVELSADEAGAANVIGVNFSKPLAFYVDNFLEFPVGTVVPVGYYDRVKGAWIASDNGVVIKVLTTDGGAATIDTTGDGIADNATSIGVTAEELQKLASTHQPGQTLWRAQITHFTPWDLNFSYIPPVGAAPPNQPQPTWFRGVEKPQTRCGSTIDCQNQVFGDAIPIDGTPFALQYQSDHATGYKAGNGVEIPLSGATLPEPLKRIDVEISVQGRVIKQSFPVVPNQTYRFLWDSLDAYGRDLQGMQIARIRVGYAYDGVYASAPEIQRAFASVSGIPISTNRGTRQELVFWQDSQALVGSLDDLPLGFGGWTLNAMKTLEPASGIVHGGAASQRTGDLQRSMIDLFAGGGTAFGTGDFGFARDAVLKLPWAVAVTPRGVVYISDWTAGTIRQVETNGIIFTAVANVGHVDAMVVGPDDALYYNQGNGIWRRGPSGTVLFAGGGSVDSNVDGVPAIDTSSAGSLMAFGPDGSLYLGGSRIRRIGADGIIYGVTGPTTLPQISNPEGRSALSTNVGGISALTVGVDGTVYFAVPNTGRVFAIPPSGTIQPFAGTGIRDANNYRGDGGPALSAGLYHPSALAAGADGSVYIVDSGYSTIRRVLPNGIVKTIAGIPFEFDGLGDRGPAAAASIFFPQRIAVGPDNTVYLTDQYYMTVRRISPPDPLANTGEYRVPSEDGGTVDVFSSTGRHLRTIDAVTGVVIQELGYDANNRLITITDAYGNITRIERGTAGTAAAIVSPFGKRTTLTIAGDGYLESVENPAGERITMTYTAGQMTSMKNARGVTKTIVYDTDGRLLSERYPDGGGITLTRDGSERDTSVTVESGEGLAAVHDRRIDDAARDNRVDVDSATGLQTTTLRTDDGASTTTLPDGTVVTEGVRGDPRFKTMAPLGFGSIRTPSGRTLSMETERSVTLSSQSDPLSLKSITETSRINGRPWKSTFTKATGMLAGLSPAGRQSTATLNAKGDIASVQVPGFAATSLTYDPQGRVISAQSGSRTFGIVYNSRGEVERITDPLSRTISFEYDAAGRLTRQTLPDVRSIDFISDENGNLISIAPPARPAHGFEYTGRDLVELYSPPESTPGGMTRYAYDRDRRLTLITRPDGATITPDYDNAGRLSTLTTPHGAYGYVYSSTTGNLASISAPDDNTLSYAYDGSLLTNVAWTGTVSGSVSYAYDNDFRVSNENGTGYLYDADNLLIAAGALSLIRHPQNGILTGTTLGSITDTYTYNEFGEVTRYTASSGTTSLLAVDYVRDAVGRITGKTETIGTATVPAEGYEYDRAGRLTKVTRAATSVAEYDYDANSNRTAHRFVGGNASATYDQQDRLLTYDDTTYTYSANGELQSRTTVGETTTFDYDALGNLRTVRIPGRRIDYVIDAQNRRIGKKIDGGLVQGWLYADQLRIVAELDETGAIATRFVYGSRSNVPDYMIKGGVTYRIIADHLGSPRLIVDAADGGIIQQITYDEFGNVTSDSAPGFQPFGFAGGLYDRDTGLLRFGARDYDPRTGRWTAKDPIGFSGGDSNLYGYVTSDPVNFIDPLGMEKLNFLPAGDPHNMAAYFDRDPANAILINSHGSNRTVNHLNARQLADRIRREAKTWKPGRRIILQSCNAAKGVNSIAQQLSAILDTTVVAADQPVWSFGPINFGSWGTWGADGEMKDGGAIDFTTKGHWITFVDGVPTRDWLIH